MGRPAAKRLGPGGMPPKSPSQIATLSACDRKWAWEKLARQPRKFNAAAQLGTECHDVLEQWEGKGIPPNPKTKQGKIVLPGLKFLPQPSKLLQLERYMMFSFGGHDWHGYKDIEYFSLFEGHRLAIVNDHKTTSDLMWALTEEQLLLDPQGVIYGYDAMLKYGTQEAWLRWIYYQTRGAKKSILVQRRVTFEEARAGMEVLVPFADRIDAYRHQAEAIVEGCGLKKFTAKDVERLALIDAGEPEASKTDDEEDENPNHEVEVDVLRSANDKLHSLVRSLPFNPLTCSAYGGCHYQQQCGLTAMQKIVSRMAQEGTKTTLAELMAKRAEEQKVTDAAGETNTTEAPEPADHPANESPNDTSDDEQVDLNPPESPSEADATAPMTDAEKDKLAPKKKVTKKKAAKKATKKAAAKKPGAKKDGDDAEVAEVVPATSAPISDEEMKIHRKNFMECFKLVTSVGDLSNFPAAWDKYVETFMSE